MILVLLSSRERINLLSACQQTYQFSGDSTDSQPNSTLSTGAMGFNGTGNLDEPVGLLNQDYFNASSHMNASVGNELINSNLSRNFCSQQTNIMHNMAAYILSSTSTSTTSTATTTTTSADNISNRGYIYNTGGGGGNMDTNWSYEIDPSMRAGQLSHTDQLYEASHQGLTIDNNNSNSNALQVTSDLIDPYTLVQQLPQSLSTSSPVHQHQHHHHHHLHAHHPHLAHVPLPPPPSLQHHQHHNPHNHHMHQIHLQQNMNTSSPISGAADDNRSSAFTTTALISDDSLNTKSLIFNSCILPQIAQTTTTTPTTTGTSTTSTTRAGTTGTTTNF
ncbi:unnamed protein product, partial [Trichobilharzia regenti]